MMRLLVSTALIGCFAGSGLLGAGPQAVPSLKTPKDWKVEVLAQPPELKWPSVVEAAPDGRIFVAEDPMDMPGPAQKPADRVLCIHPDGHITVFADNLYAVYGLRYIDGKLIIHHTPKLSVFTDDHGVGRDRVDLYDSDNPNPAPGFNDHIPSNIRLAMDGFLYMSTGDKGIYGAKSNVDGRTSEIHGGGILRIRPNGRDMEVYSTGTRNHLDVAVNDEDELFTYDNTDDGQGWWTRYTHMIDGGFYGYPYDYKIPGKPDDEKRDHNVPFQPYTLWRMAEYGGGSPTGATGYNEDALPAEYHGNTFNCEWGKGRFERFALARDGGTYKVVSMEPMIQGPKFRPVGCSVTADGTGLLVTDWEFGGWSRPDVCGRLLKLTYTGAMHPAPRPAWFIPAAQGEKFEATTEQLIAALAHPAESVRLVAQRRLGDRGSEAIAPLTALLKDPSKSAVARRHAIWALDQIDGGVSSRSVIIAVANSGNEDLSVRRQAIRQLGTRSAREATDVCQASLKDADASIRERAAIALGRIGNRSAVGALLAAMPEKDLFVHYSLFTALHRIGTADPAAWPYVVDGLRDSNPDIRRGAALAMRNAYQKPLVEALAALVRDGSAPAEARVGALGALAPLHRQQPAWDGQWWATQPAGSPPPEKTVEWDGTPLVLATINDALGDKSPAIRMAAVAAVQIAPDPRASQTLIDLFKQSNDVAFKKSVLAALATTRASNAVSAIASVLREPAVNADFIPDAIDAAKSIGNSDAIKALADFVSAAPIPKEAPAAYNALAELKAQDAAPAIGKGFAADETIATAAAESLGRVGGSIAGAQLLAAVGDARPAVRHAVINALGIAKDRASIPVLLELLKQDATRVDATAALTRMPDARAVDAYLAGLGSPDAGLRDQCRRAISAISTEARSHIESRITSNAPLSSDVIAELQQVYNRPQPIEQWDVVGPFDITAPAPFDLTHKPDQTQFKGTDGKPTKWVHLSGAELGHFELNSKFDSTEHVSAFAVAEIDSPTDRTSLFVGGSDDGLVLWVNGVKVHEDNSEHGYSPDSYRVNAHLKAGKNLIVAKTMNVGGGWEFSVAVANGGTGPIFTYNTSASGPAAYAAYAASHDGTAAKGSLLFHNAQGVGCIKCHTVGSEGGIVGPNLSGIALKYDKSKLIEDVLYPSKQIESGYEQTVIRTRSGDIESGIVKSENDQELTLYDSSARKIIVRIADIDVRKTSRISVMPEGLQAGLTQEQFADLIAYLQSLKDKGVK